MKRMYNHITFRTEDAVKYFTEAAPETFPDINLMPTTAKLKSKISSLKKIMSMINVNIIQKLCRLHYCSFKLSLQLISDSRSFPRTI
jgi:hypothetical protein